MKVIVRPHDIQLFEEKEVNENEQNIQEIQFEFSKEYNGFSKYLLVTDLKNKTIKYVIDSDNKITMPVFEETGIYYLGIYAEKIVNDKLYRLNPTPIKKKIGEGSFREAENHKEIPPSEFEQYMQILHDSLKEVDTRLKEVEETSKKVEDISVEAEKQGTYAKEQGDYAKKTTDDIKTDVSEGKFDGKSLEFVWQGTKLGVRLQGDTEYSFVELQGVQGATGPQGEAFSIKKTYSSKEAMDQDFDNMSIGDYVMIASNVNEEDNAKLYTKTETDNKWVFIADFSGAIGIQGPVGKTPHLTIGGVNTLESDQEASASITGTDENPILNLGIPKGEKGDKPVVGVDYFIETDKQDMVNSITEDADSVFNQNVDEKTQEFDNHVTEKINEFDTNVDSLSEDIDDLYNNQIVGAVIGNNIHLEDSADAKLKSLEIEGNLQQNTTTGKNLYNKSTAMTNGVENQNVANFVYLEPSTEYFFNTNNRTWTQVKLYDSDNNLTRTLGGTKTTTFLNFTTAENEVKAECIFYSGANTNVEGFDFTNIQIEKGNIFTSYEEYTGGIASPNAKYPQDIEVIEGNVKLKIANKNLFNYKSSKVTEFEPYRENICIVNLNGNYLAKTNYAVDKLKIINNHAYIEKNIEKERLVSTSKWNKLPETDTYYEYSTQSTKVGKKTQNNIKVSTHFGKDNDNKLVLAGNNNQTIYIRIPKKAEIDVSTLELWKSFLDENEVYFYYELAEPYVIDLGKVLLPKTYKSISNIFLISNLETNMKVDYIKDTEAVVNNLQKQIDDLSKVIIGEENIIVEEPIEESNEITESLENMVETLEGD